MRRISRTLVLTGSLIPLVLFGGCPPRESATTNPPDMANNSTDITGNGPNGNPHDPGDTNGTGGALPPLKPVVPPPAPAPANKTLLNEVRYNPSTGDAQWIELKIGTGGSPLAKLSLINETGDVFALPPALPTPPAGTILLILFDGLNTPADGVIHADKTDFLNRASGFVSLLDENAAEQDRVTWDMNRAASVPCNAGGVIGLPVAGTVIARRPQSLAANNSSDWNTIGPDEATPGAPNKNPGVRQLLPLDGALLEAGNVLLSWFPAVGAANYRAQVATDETFAILVSDQIVAQPRINISLQPGVYFWRVQAIALDGTPADVSYASTLELVAGLDAILVPANEVADGGAPKPRQRNQARRTALSHKVPVYSQRKDTRMLLLESDYPSGTRQAWDAPHPVGETDETDPADNTNCAICSISMVNGYFANAGNEQPYLSQDRIGLEIFTKKTNLHEGPEFDLNFHRGLSKEEYQFGLEFALNGAIAELRYIGNQAYAAQAYFNDYDASFRERFWNDLGDAIARDVPVPLSAWTGPKATGIHGMVARGRYVFNGVRYVHLNDPWHGKSYLQPLDRDRDGRGSLHVWHYFLLPAGATPRQDEEKLRSGQDRDGDGLLDFDEEMRFKTRVDYADSDQDCLNDYEEVRASVFDTRHGWGKYQMATARGLPTSSDGQARGQRQPERVIDSDGGGIPDFLENSDPADSSGAGGGLKDPYDAADDQLTIKGVFDHDALYNPIALVEPQPWGGENYYHETVHLEFELHATPNADGTAEFTGTLTAAHWTFDGYYQRYGGDGTCRRVELSTAPRDWQGKITGRIWCAGPDPDHPGQSRYSFSGVADNPAGPYSYHEICAGRFDDVMSGLLIGLIESQIPVGLIGLRPITTDDLKNGAYEDEHETPHEPGPTNDLGHDRYHLKLTFER